MPVSFQPSFVDQFYLNQAQSRLSYGIQQYQMAAQTAQINANQSFLGAQQSLLGANITAGGYVQAGADALQVAQYNADLLALNLSQELELLSRQTRQLRGQQVSAMASSGLSLGSRSFMAVTHATLNTVERMAANKVSVTRQRQAAILFEGQSAQRQYARQAQAALLQGQFSAQQQNAQGQAYQAQADSFASSFNSSSSGGFRGYTSNMTGGFTYT